MRLASSSLLLPVASDRARSHLFSRPLLDCWLEFAVVNGLMLPVLSADGRCNVALHLLWSEAAWSPGSLRMLQRCRGAIPASEPVLDRSASSGYGMAMRKRSEVVSGGAWRVLEEDLMLLLWCELLHAGPSGREAKGVRRRGLDLCIEISTRSRQQGPQARSNKR